MTFLLKKMRVEKNKENTNINNTYIKTYYCNYPVPEHKKLINKNIRFTRQRKL